MLDRERANHVCAVFLGKSDAALRDRGLFPKHRNRRRSLRRREEIGDVQLAVKAAGDPQHRAIQQHAFHHDFSCQQRKDAKIHEQTICGHERCRAIRLPDGDALQRDPNVREKLHRRLTEFHLSV